MKIEILYPEVCCLYGDKANMLYLQKCLPEAEFISTSLTEEPLFVREHIDLLYICSSSEANQEIIIDTLMPYKQRLERLIDECRTMILLTGNALEIFGYYIQREDNSRKEGLGLFDLYSVRQSPKRFNTLILAKFKQMEIVGYTSRFSQSYMDNSEICLFTVEKGCGINPNTNFEGVHFGNVYATYLLGPLLIANPDFTKYLLTRLGVKDPVLPFEEEVYLAYRKKLNEYKNPKLKLE